MIRATRNWWRQAAALALGLAIANGSTAFAQISFGGRKFDAPKVSAPKVNVPNPVKKTQEAVRQGTQSVQKQAGKAQEQLGKTAQSAKSSGSKFEQLGKTASSTAKKTQQQASDTLRKPTTAIKNSGSSLTQTIKNTAPPVTKRPEFNFGEALKQINAQRPATTPPFRPNGGGLQNVIQNAKPQLPANLATSGKPQRYLPTNVPQVSTGSLKPLPGKLPGVNKPLPAGLSTNLIKSTPGTRPTAGVNASTGIKSLSSLSMSTGSVGNLKPLVETIVSQPGKDLQTLGGILNAPLETVLGRPQSEQVPPQEQIKIEETSITVDLSKQKDADIETDDHVTTKIVVVQQPDRRAEALNLAASIVGLVQTAVASGTPQVTTGDVAVADPGLVAADPGLVSQETAVVDPIEEAPAEYTYLIVNMTEQPLTYAIRQGQSAWGSFTLAAGKKHQYVIVDAEMEVQFKSQGQPTTLTVPGDHSYAFAVDNGQVGFFLADEE